MPSKPIIVFVPGAWHLPSCFELVENLLKPAGYDCIGVRTPSVRKEPPFPKDASDDVQAIRAALVTAIGEENDVVVVMHSYGGFPGSAACKGMSKEDRVKEGKKGGVVHLVYIASFAVEEGKSMGGGDKPIPADWRITEVSSEEWCNTWPKETSAKNVLARWLHTCRTLQRDLLQRSL